MPRRTWFRSKPWIFVSADDISVIDQVIGSQTRQYTIMEDCSEIINAAALGNSPESTITIVNRTKRKRGASATVETSPSKRSKTRAASQEVTRNSSKPVPKKLGRPRKNQQQSTTNNSSVKKPKDVWDIEHASPREDATKPTANKKAKRSRKITPQNDGVPSAVQPSSPITRQRVGAAEGMKRSTRATAKDDGQDNVSLNNEVDWAKKPCQNISRPQKQAKSSRLSTPPTQAIVRDSSIPLAATPTSNIATPREERRNQPPEQPQEDDESEKEDDASGEQSDSDCVDSAGDGQEGASKELDRRQASHDESSQRANGDEATVEVMDLLGQETEWQKVLNSARNVYRFKIATDIIKSLVKDIKKAKSIYEQLRNAAETEEVVLDEQNVELQDKFEAIEEKIEALAEKTEHSERIRMHREIYSRAIPAIVFLLEAAFSLRTSQPDGLRNSSALVEIIRIQDMIVSLSHEVRGWKIKPGTGKPIIRPTSGVILPCIRDMRDKAFKKELEKLRRVEKTKHNALLSQQRSSSERRQRDAETLPENKICPYRQEEYYVREQERLHYKKKTVYDAARDFQTMKAPPAPNRSTTSRQGWTVDQTKALVRQLADEKLSNLPSKLSRICQLQHY